MGALATAVQQGKALYVGISSYGAAETERAKAILAEHKVPLLIHQPRYSMFDRTAENGLLTTLAAEGVGCIAFSPLAQGLLTDKYLSGKAPRNSRAARAFYLKPEAISETYLARARGLNAIAQARGMSLAQLAVAWVLRQPAITSVLVGASSVKQLEQNHAAIQASKLTIEELAAIDRFAVHGTAN